jgi:outer membrane protein assembly factor BamB
MSFNPDNLAAAGETELPAAVTYGPVAAGEYGLIATADGSLHGLSGESDVKWSFPLNGTYPVGSTLEGDNAFVTLANGQVLEIKLSEGAIVTTLNIGEPLKGDPLIQGGILYASGADGTLYAVGLN